jgi:hypothetical protein
MVTTLLVGRSVVVAILVVNRLSWQRRTSTEPRSGPAAPPILVQHLASTIQCNAHVVTGGQIFC